MVSYRLMVRCAMGSVAVTFIGILIIAFQVVNREPQSAQSHDYIEDPDHHQDVPESEPREAKKETKAEIPHPIILWWTPFTQDQGTPRSCGDKTCFFTIDRSYRNHPNTKVFMFYGTDFDYGDLPLPRKSHHEWGLLHEESPKNVFLFSHKEVMELFNHTSTFRRESDFPLTVQYLENIAELESRKYLISTADKNRLMREQKLALVNYVQSDCGAPSDRDRLVQMLQRHLPVDSYGTCEHNRELPKHLQDPLSGMEHTDFHRLVAQYKFTLTFENAICNDYITEKVWRPLKVGSVPIIYGSPTIEDLLPSKTSAILVSDFEKIDDLVALLKRLNQSDSEYEKYLSFKNTGVTNPFLKNLTERRTWGINNDFSKPNFVEEFECFVCRRLHENRDRVKAGSSPQEHVATRDHYGCPKPTSFRDQPQGNLQLMTNVNWEGEWSVSKFRARVLNEWIKQGLNYTRAQLEKQAYVLQFQQES